MKMVVGLLFFLTALIVFSACNQTSQIPSTITAPAQAVADNDIYFSDPFGRIHAIRPDGSEQWILKLSDEIAQLAKTPTSDEFAVEYLTAEPNGKVFGLALTETGANAGQRLLFVLNGKQMLWQQPIPYPAQGKATVTTTQTAVVVSGNDGVLYSYDRTDGHLIWKHQVSGGTLGMPTTGADGTVYVTGANRTLYAIGTNGAEKWSRSYSSP